ncbi:MAG: alkaline phosphatase D family protein [Flavobacteriales bacterium]|nr:alkaline phosphatase D family protein [Flavobacteriales bacterium]
MKSLLLLFFLGSFYGVTAQTSITPIDCVNHFYHGVASGDPLSDRVIIWTRITPDDFSSPVLVSYKMALDTGMTNIVSQGSMLTDNSRDYTVKFDVDELSPDTYYYYEFSGLGSKSVRGRTKTTPVGSVDSLRFAIVSCANLEAGYFNVYDVVSERNDVDAVLMLGDYIYEYEEGGYGQNLSIDRVFDPTHETISLDDYRLRYSVYHMDRALQKLHQNYPWICVWDDHESANDSYTNGAENHNLGEGLWSDRKLDAQRAYFEWLPIRPKAENNFEIYRKFEFGGLLDLFMVDTRLQGRNEQGVNVNDPNRTMLGTDQYQWLTNELSSSTAQWKVLGNQVIFAPVTVFGVPINGDAWDGYPAERDNVLEHVRTNDIENFTVITGDVHTSWAFNLEKNGENLGVEFVTPSVTSPGAPINGGGILTIENPHIKFVELTQHGFIILDLNQQRIQADWFFVDDINTVNSSYAWVKSLYSNAGEMQLNATTSASLPSEKYNVEMAPACPRVENSSGLNEISTVEIIGLYPNPTNGKLNVHFASVTDVEHTLIVYDLSGQEIMRKNVLVNPMNSTISVLDVSEISTGTYLLELITQNGIATTTRFVKE